jgi:mono/diheme cytochrome c family protein
VIRALAIGAAVSVAVLVLALVTPFEPSAPTAKGSAAAGDVARGATLYAATCAGCHGATGGGGVGPDITRVSAAAALSQIARGGGTMPAGLLKGQAAADVAAFVDTLDGSPAAGGATTATGSAAGTTSGAPATTAVVPSKAARQALRRVSADLHKGQSQIDILVQHTAFIEQALADNNVFNVRFHAEHLANITLGEPIRDLDGNGVASNPGDGVGLIGGGGYVTAATAPFVTIANDSTVLGRDRQQAVDAQASIDLMERRLGTVVRQAESAATVAHATDATAEIQRIRAAVDDVRTTYTALRSTLPDYALR